MINKIKSIVVKLAEVKEAQNRFPNMSVVKALELNRHMDQNVANFLKGIK